MYLNAPKQTSELGKEDRLACKVAGELRYGERKRAVGGALRAQARLPALHLVNKVKECLPT